MDEPPTECRECGESLWCAAESNGLCRDCFDRDDSDYGDPADLGRDINPFDAGGFNE